MKHYDYQKHLHSIWEKAVTQYEGGQRDAQTYFDTDEEMWLRANGITPQEIYDFAEDYVSSGEPDFATFAMICDVRRNYFFEKMKGKASGKIVSNDSYTPKDAEVDGIRWLPRIIEKAKAKLHGELDDDTMYGCGGDRAFLKEHDIHPAEFLRIVAEHEDDDRAVIDWVKQRSAAKA
ncbi:DUF5069 domain-containing protein [Ruficoccus sp. ZRK36]|uniref:DUF5069 domain-containing protein n=1 Tax=Ruficoccus sp. ZRK36 TaxID=2866311 RepID=UPI001C73721A|nr:DUF5069 domain-containing protein [Ruficoccus sp. ZRK36]QYY35796.1 DUF5069 domain-containing protein [Ruficoccus sp. ZRK36]